jgi:hypothetical protein
VISGTSGTRRSSSHASGSAARLTAISTAVAAIRPNAK